MLGWDATSPFECAAIPPTLAAGGDLRAPWNERCQGAAPAPAQRTSCCSGSNSASTSGSGTPARWPALRTGKYMLQVSKHALGSLAAMSILRPTSPVFVAVVYELPQPRQSSLQAGRQRALCIGRRAGVTVMERCCRHLQLTPTCVTCGCMRMRCTRSPPPASADRRMLHHRACLWRGHPAEGTCG